MFMSDFNEELYLIANPDVATAVSRGDFKSGLHHYEVFGKKEGRNLIKSDSKDIRKSRITRELYLDGIGLEIGAGYNPVLSKKDGYRVETVDHLDTSELKEKYRNYDGLVENIEDVDFVWKNGRLYDLIGNKERYDWIIASHVIEHIPDLLTFLMDCEALLKENGKISLVIPDKRYCFDHFRPLTTTGQILDAWHFKYARPTPGQIFDQHANSVNLNNQFAWAIDSIGELQLGPTGPFGYKDNPKNLFNNAINSNVYIDVHCWCFNLASFGLILSDLKNLGLCGLEIVSEIDSIGCEFYITLAKSQYKKNTQLLSRFELLKRINNYGK